MATMSTTTTLGDDEKYEIAVSYGTIIATGSLAILVCGTRLYIRRFMLHTFGIDDWACLFGLLFVTAFNGIGLAVVYYGAGKHIQNVSQEDLAKWFMLYYVCICMYLSISFAVKSSILFFLRRVFPTPYIQRTTMALFIFIAIFTVSGSFLAAFQCNPPKYAYDLNFLMSPERANHCFSSDVAYGIFMYQAVVIFCCDIIMLLLPFPVLLKLHMSSAKSVALVMVFGSGIVACIAPAIRFRSLNFYKTGSTDTTFEGASSLYWMAIEYNLGLVAGSLTGLRPLFAKFGLFSTTNNSNEPSYKKNEFSPSYQLEDQSASNKSWSRRGQGGRTRYQGDSVLEQTIVGGDGGDRSSQEDDEARIVKTQVFTVTEAHEDLEMQKTRTRAQ
ncbi:hypothetical protein GQ53DRAFT_787095 [Thozetella sp. PMI_491]|nr:hypothetical protein GQ53DRAFT_787095 [Thozetella sp. PMI_491]